MNQPNPNTITNIINEKVEESKQNTEINNTSTQNQIQEAKPEDNIPELNSQQQIQIPQNTNPPQQSQQIIPQQNQNPPSSIPPQQTQQIIPQQNQNPPSSIPPQQAQQINQQQNQIQPMPQVQAQPPPVPKVVFTHPMNNYCSEEKIKEIETCPPTSIFLIVQKRFDEVHFKLLDILRKHERYTLFSIYFKVYQSFLMNRQIGKNPEAIFRAKDPSLRLKISDFDFSDALNMLNCQLTSTDLSLILKSLTQKTNTLYSYDEFINKVYNIQKEENGQMSTIYKQCSFYFNDYLYSFRHYIQDNRIDYKSAFIRCCSGITTLTYELFNKFLGEIGFKIGHENEKQYIFSSLCDANYLHDHIDMKINAYVHQKTLFYIADLSDVTEEDFIKSGIVVESIKKNTDWIKYIKNFTEETKELNKKNYQSLENIIKNIHEKSIRYDIKDLVTYFSELEEDISPEGEMDIDDFRKAMNNIGVTNNLPFENLILQFKDNKKRLPKGAFKLVDFLSVYNLFIEDEKINIGDSKVEFKEENLNGTNAAPEKSVVYVHANAHRKFTQQDIDYISDICSSIADIIILEKNDSVTNFFTKRDKKGFFFFKEFKEILEKDLEISFEGSEQDIEDFNVFFDFVKADRMVQGSDIVKTKYLIHIITYYSGKDAPSNQNKNITNNLENSNQNNGIKFEEEINTRGTQAPNVNENKPNKNVNVNEDINTNSSNINNQVNQENQVIQDNNRGLTEIINTDINTSEISFDKIMSNFAQHLFNNRIRFNDIFPSIDLEKVINNQTISADTLSLGFKNAGFEITDKEFVVLMTHFDPINSNNVQVEELKHEIAKNQPKYFNQSYQKINQNIIKEELINTNYTVFNRDKSKNNLLNGMNKIQNFMIRNKISPDNFFYGRFCKKNRNENFEVSREGWKNAFIPKEKMRSDFIPFLEAKEVDAVYTEMNPRLNESIFISKIIEFFNKYMKKDEKLIDFNDKTTLNETIKNEIKILFDNFDVNKTDQISFEDFYKCLKSVDHKATKLEAQDILAQHTNTNFSNVDRATFNEIIYNYIQKSLVIQKEEKDFIMNLFREADIDKNGYLTRNQIKYLINNKINCNLTDSELNDILDKVDVRNENEIDIRDFIFLLDNINNNQNMNNLNEINTMSNNMDNEALPIMNLNLNLNMHRKIRPKDFISLYTGLPLSFIPSFIREEQQKNNLLPSKCLKPLTKDDILYEDIFPLEAMIYTEKKDNRNQPYGIIATKKLKQFVPIINCKIYFDDYATGVSSPDETLFETPNSQFKVVGRLLKISLFNNMYNIFVGNAVSIDCIYKKEYQDRWYFEDDDSKYNNNIIIRYNRNNIEDIDVVFEFVLVIQKKVEQKLYTIETSCGWCKIPMTFLQNSRKEKLKIMGGSPFGASDISENDIRKKRIGFIPKLATLFEGVIRSECPIRVKLFNDLSNEEKKNINYLPGLIVCHSAAMQMISLFRQELGEYILNHKDYLLKSIKDEFDLGNMFCKIADVPDAFRVMNEVWKEIIIDGAPSGRKEDEDYLRFNFELYVKKINSVLYAERFKYNPLDPTELPRGDIKLMQDRDILLNSALRSGLGKKFNKLDYKMEDYSYKPFTMDEINGQKGNSILEKIDEMITFIGE